jgi:cadmium resistance protein CadD (predicted permease)
MKLNPQMNSTNVPAEKVASNKIAKNVLKKLTKNFVIIILITIGVMIYLTSKETMKGQ